MKVGSFVFATWQGLGVLAKSFFDHGIVTDVMVISHGTHPNQDWYMGAELITNLRSSVDRERMERFCASMDVMLFFETPFHWPIIDYCLQKGVKTVIMPMHECMLERIPCHPDLWLCPSLLDLKWAIGRNPGPISAFVSAGEMFDTEGGSKAVFLPVPVEVPWRQRNTCEVFVHNAGNGSFQDRNGTQLLLDAMPLVKSPIKLILRAQERAARNLRGINDNRIDLRIGTQPYETLWDDGDTFVFCERFNGLCLPLQEARAAGMLCIAGDRFPVNTWLPSVVPSPESFDGTPLSKNFHPLVPMTATTKSRIGPPYSPFDRAEYMPQDVAAKINSFFGLDISEYSKAGKAWAEENSWQVLKPRYMEVLECLTKTA